MQWYLDNLTLPRWLQCGGVYLIGVSENKWIHEFSWLGKWEILFQLIQINYSAEQAFAIYSLVLAVGGAERVDMEVGQSLNNPYITEWCTQKLAAFKT